MVAHPARLTPGDVLYIFPETTLALNTPISVPPKPDPGDAPKNLYPANDLLKIAFPKYFSFVTDLQSRANTTRIRVKKIVTRMVPRDDPAQTEGEVTMIPVEESFDELYEVRVIGELIASQDRGPSLRNDGSLSRTPGRTLLSNGDNVVVRFTEDIAKIMDSDTYDDADPYFTSFAIYSHANVVQEPDRQRSDYGRSLGNLMYYKGRLTVVSRVEGLAPPVPSDSRRAKVRGLNNQDTEDVTYIGKIVYSEDAISLGDKVVLFLPLKPGPERRLDSPYVEPADSYRAPGK
jgi:hypothetical protein